ncbi:PQQ-dependent sugar dehydrogenase [Candidatus Reidiella endopervernicosa]|uniref:PQQ-dependent sugar dehydrogenase n=2 Tax=Candidatus Reidiella endopervernicosa TaxID=2738883 RepID=A0A6N0I160_9GAMM|nr:PQQ-dependent sugar dehydrogenase [Candidatus Reidiella endopervernicosa]
MLFLSPALYSAPKLFEPISLPAPIVIDPKAKAAADAERKKRGGSDTSPIVEYKRELPLEQITLPSGFEIEIYSDQVPNARTLTVGDQGTLFVGTRTLGKVYALPDKDGDGKVDKVIEVGGRHFMPNGVTFHKGALYVAENRRILRYNKIEENLEKQLKPETVYSRLPTERYQGWRYIRFGPDGQLYISIGAPCNICSRSGFGQIVRLDLEKKRIKPFVTGVRNSGGFDWHPETGGFWFTDTARNWVEGEQPQDELNYAPLAGLHFGFPYCFGKGMRDPEYGVNHHCGNYRSPVVELGAHVSPLGMLFYTGKGFPSAYQERLYLVENGSWDQQQKRGFKIWMATVKDGRKRNEEIFASGWAGKKGEMPWGRLVDVAVAKDGALLVSDDLSGVIYRISYNGK